MPAPRFVHLRLHSEYSVSDGIVRVEEAVAKAATDGMPALALTDAGNVFGMVKFYSAAREAGVKPIIGADCWVQNDADRDKPWRLLLLCASREGYLRLSLLLSRAWLKNQHRARAEISSDWLREPGTEGLIALSGFAGGDVGHALATGNANAAEKFATTWAKLFPGRYYLEVQRAGAPHGEPLVGATLALAVKLGLPVVATHPVQFVAPGDFKAHEARVCISQGYTLGDQRRPRLFTAEQYFKTQDEMARLWSDAPQVLANSVEIARRCNFELVLGKSRLPDFPTPAGVNLDQYLRQQAEQGLARRLEKLFPDETVRRREAPIYNSRLQFETGMIVKMGFAGYFLIVADFINWARSNGVPVGPGRGSGAGSLVAYALGITGLDPLKYDLLFERFLNPERVSMPDFDIYFCQTRRGEVIDYVRERYGADRVAQIITFGSFLARGVLRSVGRVLEMPLGQVDKLAKLVPQNPAKPISLPEAVGTEQKLREAAEEDGRVARLFKIAGALEGLYSNASTHAAGVVIGDGPLDEVTPLYRDPKSDMPATQFNMKWVEPAGLVKFDFLGLKTLTVIAECVALLGRRGIKVNPTTIPLDDQETFAMLQRGETFGMFQVESAGMKKALVDMRPDRFEDLIALVALYRPGPMANIPSYCARKLGDEPIEYDHPALEPILKETFGVITYQEQVQQIARDLAGYSLGQADILRRAMGKKIKAEMDAQRERFVSGATERGLKTALANTIFDACAKFAEYGFNKSHSAPYAFITYQTAYLKAHYPVEFLAASMTFDKSNTDKLAEFRDEAKRLGVAVEPPSINRSGVNFDVSAQDSAPGADGKFAIRYALSAVKGVGEGQAESIVRSRGDRPFTSLSDFARRLNPREVNKKALENLACCGAFDELEPDRARAFAAIEAVLAGANRCAEERRAGQNALFGDAGGDDLAIPRTQPWPSSERLRREFEAAGFFLSGHPLDSYAGVLSRLRVTRWAEFAAAVKRGATAGRLAAVVLDRIERRTKSGSKMGIAQLSDVTGQYEAILFQEGLAQYRDLLEKGATVLVALSAAVEGEDVRARIVSVEPLAAAAARAQRGLRIVVRDNSPLDRIKSRLSARGEGEVYIVLQREKSAEEIEIRLPGGYPVSAEVAGALKAIPGVVAVEHV